MTIFRGVAALVLSALMSLPVSAGAASKLKQLGTDPSFDAPPAADVTSLAVGRDGDSLVIQLGVNVLLPAQGSYPEAGLEWTFDVGSRTFVAEGHPELGGTFAYTLFEVVTDSFREVAEIDGAIDTTAGTLTMFVPLRLIGAGKGSRVSGAGETGAMDVDVHLHAGPASRLLDEMATTKDYVVR